MSRRRGEFEHRTSIFEGAYRAWSHLGGVDPLVLSTSTAADLDPLSHPHENDPRIHKDSNSSASGSSQGVGLGVANKSKSSTKSNTNTNSNTSANGASESYTVTDSTGRKRCYPYEPLPRSGLAHPFVQAIISPWLGPDAEHEDIVLGLTTLRTWWQHRRKGESSSAKSSLGTEKMRGVVEGYTRHFFNLAHCIVLNDGEQPPRTLSHKIKECEKSGVKLELATKKKDKEKDLSGGATMGGGGRSSLNAASAMDASFSSRNGNGMGPGSASASASINNGNHNFYGNSTSTSGNQISSTPTQHIHFSQQHHQQQQQNQLQMGSQNGTMNMMNANGVGFNSNNPTDMDMVDDNTERGTCCSGAAPTSHPIVMNEIQSSSSPIPSSGNSKMYGDPNKMPVVFVSEAGDIQIAMSIAGITCNNCVKIIETVLKGVNGSPSPIHGLIDCAADRELSSVLIKIEKSSYAKRIAYEASENLKMVGYEAEPKEMGIMDVDSGAAMDLGALRTAFDVVAATDAKDVFDWSLECSCPDNGIVRADCARHFQMNKRIFEAFEEREKQVKTFMAGCSRKYGMPCTCGSRCKCSSGKCCGPSAANNNTNVNNTNSVRAMAGGAGLVGNFATTAPSAAAASSDANGGDASSNLGAMNNAVGGDLNVDLSNAMNNVSNPHVAFRAVGGLPNAITSNQGSTHSMSMPTATMGGNLMVGNANANPSAMQNTSGGGTFDPNNVQAQVQPHGLPIQGNHFFQNNAQTAYQHQQPNVGIPGLSGLNVNATSQMLSQGLFNANQATQQSLNDFMRSVNQSALSGNAGGVGGVNQNVWPEYQQSNSNWQDRAM